MLRIPSPVAFVPESPNTGEPLPSGVRSVPPRALATARPSPRQLTPGQPSTSQLEAELETELSCAAALAPPLSVGGAALLAYGASLPNQTCTTLGTLIIAGAATVIARARHRLRQGLFREATRQGMSPSEGKNFVHDYLKKRAL